MLLTAIVIFRETLEIAMILGIVLAATRGIARRFGWIMLGLVGGIFGAALIAAFADAISASLSGMGQEMFNAAILFTAAVLIGWTVLWMRKHARHLSAHIKQVGKDIHSGQVPLYSLAFIIGLAMLREGAEMVMFVYGMLLSGQSSTSVISGSLAGLAAGILCGTLLYYGLLKMPARYMLTVTSWLLLLLVAGLSSQGASYLVSAGFFPNFSQVMWDSSWLLSQDSYLGKALQGLIGYSARPTQVQISFYVGTLLFLLLLMHLVSKPRPLTPAPFATEPPSQA